MRRGASSSQRGGIAVGDGLAETRVKDRAVRQPNKATKLSTIRATTTPPVNQRDRILWGVFPEGTVIAPSVVARPGTPSNCPLLAFMPGPTNPALTAYIAASVRVVTPILAKILRRCTLTVFVLIYSEDAISLLLTPVATRNKISLSRSLRSLMSVINRSRP